MKNSFKMEFLLKLKKFKEQNEKMKMGKILKKMDENKYQISILNKKLEDMYDCQFKDSKGCSYSTMIDATRNKIKDHHKNLKDIEKEYRQVQKNLNIALGEVKALQKMKNVHERSLKRKKDIKREGEIEDIINMRRANG